LSRRAPCFTSDNLLPGGRAVRLTSQIGLPGGIGSFFPKPVDGFSGYSKGPNWV